MKTSPPDTQQEIYHDLLTSIGQMRESLGQLQGTVEALKDQRQETVEALKDQRKEMVTLLASLDDRLRTVERRAAMGGIITSGVITTVLAAIGFFFQIKTSG